MFSAYSDDDLLVSHKKGYARQKNLAHIVDYGQEYFNKCAGYQNSEIANKLNIARDALVRRHYGDGLLVDVGIGSGEFVQHRPNTVGTDINPVAIEWLKNNGKLADSSLSRYYAFTFWDVIEHMPHPDDFMDCVPVGAKVFFSIPIFHDLSRIRESKHYRPGEHLYYWTRSGFISWLLTQGFYLLEMNDAETQCGRDSIESFAFVRMFK